MSPSPSRRKEAKRHTKSTTVRASAAAFAPESTLTVTTARPSAYSALAAQLAVVMIDWQRDFLEEGGFAHCLGNDVAVLRPAVEPARALLAAARAAGLTVVHTIESHKADLSDLPPNKLRRCAKIGQVAGADRGRMLIRGEPGNALIAELAPLADELVVYKPGKGAFYATGLEEQLRALGITHLLFTGVTTEVCVQTSMREANDRGFDCLLVSDATESYFPEFKASVLEQVVAQGGIIGWTADSADVIRALRAAADGGGAAAKP